METQNQSTNKTVTYNDADFKREAPTVGIEFFNINSGEKRLGNSEAMITALYNSSNLHANAMVGQDFGWRLSPKTIKRMREIREDEAQMDRIVTRFRLTELGEVTDPHLLTYMFQSDLQRDLKTEEAQQENYARQYEDEIRALDAEPTPATDGGTKPRATPSRLNASQKKIADKQAADAKRREENLAEGRDINDGIDLTSEQKKALGNGVANSNDNDDNNTQS